MAVPIIETVGLTKKYNGVAAVDDLNLTINDGEVFGLLGPNGAGKTTTTLMLLGLTEPTAGSASIAGLDCARDSIRIKEITGYLPDNVGFYPELTGRQNLRFTGELNGLDGGLIEQRIDELLEKVGMTQAADKKVSAYSRGMRQRLGIADVLMKDPKVIIMDEPTLGIDPEGMRELTVLIRRLSTEDGRTILISSHQLYQIQQICDRVGIFVGGKLIACGAIEELGEQLENDGSYVFDIQVSKGESDASPEEILKAADAVTDISSDADGTLHVTTSGDAGNVLIRALLENGCGIKSLHQSGGDLDEIYSRYFKKAGDTNDNTDAGHAGSAGKSGSLWSRISGKLRRDRE